MAEGSARIAGTVKIDGVAAARDVIVISDDPSGRQVVGEGVSAGDGSFDITYTGWTGPVIALALDNYGQAWSAEAPLNNGTVVHPTAPNGYVYQVTSAGTTGTDEPTWSTDSAVQSGGVTFNPRPYYRPIASGPLQGKVIEDDQFDPASMFANGQVGAWFDPSDLATLFTDESGTIQVSSDGDPVGLMLDKSGNEEHAYQSNPSARPIYRTDGQYHWLEFAGSQFMEFDQRIAGDLDRTIVAAIQPTAAYLNNAFFDLTDINHNGQSGRNWYLSWEGDIYIRVVGNDYWANPIGIDQDQIIAVQWGKSLGASSASAVVRNNGATLPHGGGNSAAINTIGGGYSQIGRTAVRSADYQSPFQGRIYGLFVAGALYGAAEIDQLEQWFDAKSTAELSQE